MWKTRAESSSLRRAVQCCERFRIEEFPSFPKQLSLISDPNVCQLYVHTIVKHITNISNFISSKRNLKEANPIYFENGAKTEIPYMTVAKVVHLVRISCKNSQWLLLLLLRHQDPLVTSESLFCENYQFCTCPHLEPCHSSQSRGLLMSGETIRQSA